MVTAFLVSVAVARGVHVAIENPIDSHLFKFWQQLCPDMLKYFVRHSVHRCPYEFLPD